MKMFNVQKSESFVCFNAAEKPSTYGPSIAEIRNAEVQKSAPLQEKRDEAVREGDQEKTADDDERAA
jgi:hypothetical protein